MNQTMGQVFTELFSGKVGLLGKVEFLIKNIQNLVCSLRIWILVQALNPTCRLIRQFLNLIPSMC
jgi:hypothetical protein